jgi:hypothetical protein
MIMYDNICPHCFKDNSDKQVIDQFDSHYEGGATDDWIHECVHCKEEFTVIIEFEPRIDRGFDIETFLKINKIEKPKHSFFLNTCCLEEFIENGENATRPESWDSKAWGEGWEWAKQVYAKYIKPKMK